MKNIFVTSKRGIAAILILCILFSVFGLCVNVTAVAEETTVSTEAIAVTIEKTTVATDGTIAAIKETTVVTEETLPELMPQMTEDCDSDGVDGVDIGGWDGGYPGNDGSVAPGAGWEWSGKPNSAVGSNEGSWIISGTLYYLWGHFSHNGGGHGPHRHDRRLSASAPRRPPCRSRRLYTRRTPCTICSSASGSGCTGPSRRSSIPCNSSLRPGSPAPGPAAAPSPS